MNKIQLIQQVALTTGAHRINVATIVEATVEAMADALISGEDVNIVGFGAFRLKFMLPRIGRNPKTGESVSIPRRRSLRFVPSVMLSRRVKTTEALPVPI